MSWTVSSDTYTLLSDGDLWAAFHYHGLHVAAEPVEVLVELTGANDGPNWHWMLRLADGSFAYVTGGCDYTGWDCQSSAEAFGGATLDEVFAHVPEAERGEMRQMLAEAVEIARTLGDQAEANADRDDDGWMSQYVNISTRLAAIAKEGLT